MGTQIPGNTTSSEQDTTPKTAEEILETDETSEEEEETTEEESEEESTEEEETTESEKESTEEEEKVEEEAPEEVDSEEELEAETKITHPSWKTIKEKYPELAKDRNFRNIFFQNAAFTEMFPTISEAKEAVTKAGHFEEIDSHLVSGDLSPILKNINEETLNKLAERVLPALAEVDIKFFQRATRPLVIDIMNNIQDYANKTEDENLKKSIRNVSKFLTGNADIPARITSPTESPEVKQELDKLRSERERLFLKDKTKFLASTDSIVFKKMEQMILDGLDPDKKLSDFDRQAVAERTMKDLNERLNNDEGLVSKIKTTIGLAAKAGFPDMYKSRIISATLDRAKKLAPGIRSKHKLAALGKQPPKSNTKIVAGEKTETVKTTSARVTSAKQIDMGKTSAEDFLNDKVTLRK